MQIMMFLFVLSTGIICGFCQANSNVTVSQDIDTCKATDHFKDLLGKEVTIQGRVIGFHYLVMTDGLCAESNRGIYINLDPKKRELLIERLKKFDPGRVYRNENLLFFARFRGVLDEISLTDNEHPCFVPKGILSPDVGTCLRVSEVLDVNEMSDSP